MRLAVPNNRQVRYENHTIQLDNFADGQRQTSDDANFEFNFNNAGFSRLDEFPNSVTNHNSPNTYYTDFTGSREVGIDVGPFVADGGGSSSDDKMAVVSKKSSQTTLPELPPLPDPPKFYPSSTTNLPAAEQTEEQAKSTANLIGIVKECLIVEKR